MSRVDSIMIIISLSFSLLAAAMAFLITYKEWAHHYTDTREPTKHGIKAALVTFIFFAVLSILASEIISKFITNQ